MTQLKIIVEKHPDGYIAYPLGRGDGVVGRGKTSEHALSNVKAALRSQADSVEEQASSLTPAIIEAFVSETGVKVWW